MHWHLKPQALKNLKRLPKEAQQQIIIKLDFYTNTKNPLQFAKRMQKSSLGDYRFRVGDYRIIFDLEKDSLVVLVIGNRKNIYR